MRWKSLRLLFKSCISCDVCLEKILHISCIQYWSLYFLTSNTTPAVHCMVTDIVLIGTSSRNSSTTSLRKLKFFFPSSLSKKYSKEKLQINEFCKWIVPTDVEYLQLEIDHHWLFITKWFFFNRFRTYTTTFDRKRESRIKMDFVIAWHVTDLNKFRWSCSNTQTT